MCHLWPPHFTSPSSNSFLHYSELQKTEIYLCTFSLSLPASYTFPKLFQWLPLENWKTHYHALNDLALPFKLIVIHLFTKHLGSTGIYSQFSFIVVMFCQVSKRGINKDCIIGPRRCLMEGFLEPLVITFFINQSILNQVLSMFLLKTHCCYCC